MANRSYLYAVDILPAPGEKRPPAKGVSEWNWDIPLVHKVLLSGDPQLRSSIIWESDEVFAVAGDYAAGVANLAAFLGELRHPEADVQAAEALEWLQDPVRARKYLWLEAAEIFDMDEDRGLKESAEALLAEVGSDWSGVAATVPAGQLAAATGAGSWSEVLYYGPFD